MSWQIRKALREDGPTILRFIRELARYEELEHKVEGTLAHVQETLFSPNAKAEALILEVSGEAAGFALFFHNYSTFLCRHGLYIEDIFVAEPFRGKGYGKAFFHHICALAKERNCGRVEWWCLDNNKSAVDFYLKLGAEPMVDWTVYRLNKAQITQMTTSL